MIVGRNSSHSMMGDIVVSPTRNRPGGESKCDSAAGVLADSMRWAGRIHCSMSLFQKAKAMIYPANEHPARRWLSMAWR